MYIKVSACRSNPESPASPKSALTSLVTRKPSNRYRAPSRRVQCTASPTTRRKEIITRRGQRTEARGDHYYSPQAGERAPQIFVEEAISLSVSRQRLSLLCGRSRACIYAGVARISFSFFPRVREHTAFVADKRNIIAAEIRNGKNFFFLLRTCIHERKAQCSFSRFLFSAASFTFLYGCHTRGHTAGTRVSNEPNCVTVRA